MYAIERRRWLVERARISGRVDVGANSSVQCADVTDSERIGTHGVLAPEPAAEARSPRKSDSRRFSPHTVPIGTVPNQ